MKLFSNLRATALLLIAAEIPLNQPVTFMLFLKELYRSASLKDLIMTLQEHNEVTAVMKNRWIF